MFVWAGPVSRVLSPLTSPICRARQAAPWCPCHEVRLRGAAVRGLAHASPGARPRRDARVRHGPRPLTRPHGAPARARHPADVRLQGRQVAGADRAVDAAGGLLGGRATTRTLGGPAPMATTDSRPRSRAPSARAPGPRRAFVACSPAVYASTCRRSSNRRPSRRCSRRSTSTSRSPGWPRCCVAVVGNRRSLVARRARLMPSTATTVPGSAIAPSRRRGSTRVRSSHAIQTAAFAVLFTFTGFLLWYGERDTRFRFAKRC